MLSKTVSTAISAFVLVMPVLFTTSLIMSSLIKMSSLTRHKTAEPDPAGTANLMIRLGLQRCQADAHPRRQHQFRIVPKSLLEIRDRHRYCDCNSQIRATLWHHCKFIHFGVVCTAPDPHLHRLPV